ncbi:hypothetical protein [Streptomyces rubiginosohelvolus]
MTSTKPEVRGWGTARPAVQRFPLAEAAAHRALETRGTMGTVVLEP